MGWWWSSLGQLLGGNFRSKVLVVMGMRSRPHGGDVSCRGSLQGGLPNSSFLFPPPSLFSSAHFSFISFYALTSVTSSSYLPSLPFLPVACSKLVRTLQFISRACAPPAQLSGLLFPPSLLPCWHFFFSFSPFFFQPLVALL